MPQFSIRHMSPADGPAVTALQQAYTACHSGVPIIAAEVYLSPSFQGGEEVFCAFKDDQLIAYAPLFFQTVEAGPAHLPHVAWTEVKATPGLPGWEEVEVKDALLERVLARICERIPTRPSRPVRVTFEYATNEEEAAAFVQARGFEYLESVFHMRRDLSEPIPEPLLAPGLTLRRWRMESEEEQRAYVAARCACFPEAPLALADWQYYMSSPIWSAGTMVAAFAGDTLAGCVNTYWVPGETDAAEPPFGFTEDIFVLPEFRGRGAARAMIAEAMRFLKEHGLREARLAVRAKNEQALPLYRGMGYTVAGESRFYARMI